MLYLRSGKAVHKLRPGRDHLGLVGPAIEACQGSCIAPGVNDIGILWVRRNVAAFSSADGIPIRLIDSAMAGF